MRKSYVIQWKSKVNGRAGKGTKVFPREEGEQLVEELNHGYPDIHHELAETDQEPPRISAQSEAESKEHDAETEPVRRASPALVAK